MADANSEILQRLEALRTHKNATWMSPDSVQGYMQGSDPNTNGIAAINDDLMHRAFLEYSPRGSRVFDVGCGHGITSICLADHGCSVVACDISQNMLNVLDANKGARDIETRQGDAYNLPNRGELFDTIVARHFLPHFFDWPVILKDMERCLKPGGHLVMHFSSRENREMGETLGPKDCQWPTYSDPKTPGGSLSQFSADANTSQFQAVAATLGMVVKKTLPFHFFYENRMIGHSLGTEAYAAYIAQLKQRLANPAVLDFVLWFENTVVRNFPPSMTYPCIFVLEKRRQG